jgi:hypothetical protein
MLLGVVVTSITAISCSPDSTSPVQGERGNSQAVGTQSRSLLEQYAWVGQYHNDALAYALTKVKASKRTSKYDRCKVGLAALKDFQKAYKKEGRTAVFDDLTLTDGMCEAAAVGNFAASASLGGIGNRRPSHDISSVANNYMNQLVTQTYTATTIPGLSFAVNKIVNQAEASVVPLEAAAVASVGSVEISSASYWDANEGSWSNGGQLAYNRGTVEILPGVPVNMGDRTRRILRADVAAAISTLLADWWMGEVAVSKACIRAAAASFIAAISAY